MVRAGVKAVSTASPIKCASGHDAHPKPQTLNPAGVKAVSTASPIKRASGHDAHPKP